jgi:PAS domain S-box-containing protein
MKTPKILVDSESLEKLDLPIFIKNTDGIYVYCNKAFVDFLGISRNAILGHTAYDIAPKKLADIYAEADKQLFSTSQNQCYDSVVHASEAEKIVRFNKAPLYSPEHQITGFIGSIDTSLPLKIHHLREQKKLTHREIDVLSLLIKGFSVKAMASKLQISSHTVTHYLKSIYSKLDAHSKNEALFKALTIMTINPP